MPWPAPGSVLAAFWLYRTARVRRPGPDRLLLRWPPPCCSITCGEADRRSLAAGRAGARYCRRDQTTGAGAGRVRLRGLAVAWLIARRGVVPLIRALALIAALVVAIGRRAGGCAPGSIPAAPHTRSSPVPTRTCGHLTHQPFLWPRSRLAARSCCSPGSMLVGPASKFADSAVFGMAGLLLVAGVVVAIVLRRARPTPDVLFLAVACGAYSRCGSQRPGNAVPHRHPAADGHAVDVAALANRSGAAALARPHADGLLAVGVVYEGAADEHGVPARRAAAGHLRAEGSSPWRRRCPTMPRCGSSNRRAVPSERTYLLFCEECGYYIRTAQRGDWHGTYPYRWLPRWKGTRRRTWWRASGRPASGGCWCTAPRPAQGGNFRLAVCRIGLRAARRGRCPVL